jgi:hypothetical protein
MSSEDRKAKAELVYLSKEKQRELNRRLRQNVTPELEQN